MGNNNVTYEEQIALEAFGDDRAVLNYFSSIDDDYDDDERYNNNNDDNKRRISRQHSPLAFSIKEALMEMEEEGIVVANDDGSYDCIEKRKKTKKTKTSHRNSSSKKQTHKRNSRRRSLRQRIFQIVMR